MHGFCVWWNPCTFAVHGAVEPAFSVGTNGFCAWSGEVGPMHSFCMELPLTFKLTARWFPCTVSVHGARGGGTHARFLCSRAAFSV